jgi:ABC-type transporter Mla maintaining outer membrane lipid asymmetry permease subunit MlaE
MSEESLSRIVRPAVIGIVLAVILIAVLATVTGLTGHGHMLAGPGIAWGSGQY